MCIERVTGFSNEFHANQVTIWAPRLNVIPPGAGDYASIISRKRARNSRVKRRRCSLAIRDRPDLGATVHQQPAGSIF
jgi:hypothetical protein